MEDHIYKTLFKALMSIAAIVVIVIGLKVIKNALPGSDINSNSAGKDRTVNIALMGNVLLSDKLLSRYKDSGYNGFLSDSLINTIKDSDISIMNQTFSFSSYTNDYNVNSDNIFILQGLGIDITSLANNYFMSNAVNTCKDTLYYLDEANIKHAGAGEDIDEASKVALYSCKDINIGLQSINITNSSNTGVATNATSHVASRPGIYGESSLDTICFNIEKAKKSCDYLILSVSWGDDSSNTPTKIQQEQAKAFIDAGADIVVGCSNLMQGIEYYNNKPIIYSIGNFLNTSYRNNTELIELSIDSDYNSKLKIHPCITEAYNTRELTKKEKSTFFNNLKKISYNVNFSKKGIVTQ